MSRPSPISRALGLPPHAQRHPDPKVRRAYWAAAKMRQREAARSVEQRNYERCRRNFGGGRCNSLLLFGSDRNGRVTVTCQKCERRERGICACCPRRVTGTIGRALYCDRCRTPETYRRKRQREVADRDHFNAQKRRLRRAARRQLLRDLRSPIPEVRAKAEARRAHLQALGRATRERRRERKSAARETSTRRAA